MIVNEHRVPSITATRLSEYCIGLFPSVTTKSASKKVIKNDRIMVNNTLGTTGTWVNSGDLIELLDEAPRAIWQMNLDVLFEDDALAVILKPSGIPTSGNSFKTIQNALQHNLTPSQAIDAIHPRPAHRLDAATSGILLIGKSSEAIIALNRAFENGEIQKTYHAVVQGFPVDGSIDLPIEYKTAHSDLKVVRQVPSMVQEQLSLVELKPTTGRTHQLRIHMAGKGHPIIGDKIHNDAKVQLNHKGLFLAATSIAFSHPTTGNPISFSTAIPPKFTSLLDREQRRYDTNN